MPVLFEATITDIDKQRACKLLSDLPVHIDCENADIDNQGVEKLLSPVRVPKQDKGETLILLVIATRALP